MAQFATETIAEQQNQAESLYIIKVIKARKQAVAGTNFYLTLKLGFVDNEDGYERCEVVVFDQPWTNTRELKDVKCVRSLSGLGVEKTNNPIDSSVLFSKSGFGGVIPADTNDPDVQQIAQLAIETIGEKYNEAGNIYLIRVIKARKQVVAGTIYNLTVEFGFRDKKEDKQVCEVVVFDQPWTNRRELTDVACSQALSEPKVQEANRPGNTAGLGSQPCFGCINPGNPNDPEVQKMAQFATEFIAQQQDQIGNLYLIKVLQALTQVVSGVKYYLTLKIGFLDKQDDTQQCEIVVYDVPWTNKREFTNMACVRALSGQSNTGSANRPEVLTDLRSLLISGSSDPADPSSAEINEIAKFATTAVADQQKLTGQLRLIRVKEAKKQLVGGTNYFLTLELASAKNEQNKQECDVIVFDQPETKTRKLVDVKCSAPLTRLNAN